MTVMSFSADETIHKPLEPEDNQGEGSVSEEPFDETMKFSVEKEKTEAGKILDEVYAALKEKGYNPINQLVGYLLSGDPTYITNYKDARSIIRRAERDELLEELVRHYLKGR
jgi:uncharacterized protein (UPF0297 family)